MTNLYTGTINTNGEYKKLETETGLTFENNTKYVIQIQNQANLREGTTGEGFLINSPMPVQYTKESADLYIKTTKLGSLVNISN